jgi:hypothetical protein
MRGIVDEIEYIARNGRRTRSGGKVPKSDIGLNGTSTGLMNLWLEPRKDTG